MLLGQLATTLDPQNSVETAAAYKIINMTNSPWKYSIFFISAPHIHFTLSVKIIEAMKYVKLTLDSNAD